MGVLDHLQCQGFMVVKRDQLCLSWTWLSKCCFGNEDQERSRGIHVSSRGSVFPSLFLSLKSTLDNAHHSCAQRGHRETLGQQVQVKLDEILFDIYTKRYMPCWNHVFFQSHPGIPQESHDVGLSHLFQVKENRRKEKMKMFQGNSVKQNNICFVQSTKINGENHSFKAQITPNTELLSL